MNRLILGFAIVTTLVISNTASHLSAGQSNPEKVDLVLVLPLDLGFAYASISESCEECKASLPRFLKALQADPWPLVRSRLPIVDQLPEFSNFLNLNVFSISIIISGSSQLPGEWNTASVQSEIRTIIERQISHLKTVGGERISIEFDTASTPESSLLLRIAKKSRAWKSLDSTGQNNFLSAISYRRPSDQSTREAMIEQFTLGETPAFLDTSKGSLKFFNYSNSSRSFWTQLTLFSKAVNSIKNESPDFGASILNELENELKAGDGLNLNNWKSATARSLTEIWDEAPESKSDKIKNPLETAYKILKEEGAIKGENLTQNLYFWANHELDFNLKNQINNIIGASETKLVAFSIHIFTDNLSRQIGISLESKRPN